jgi:membrane-associated protease RseP (regulator of RpoE activity)
VDQLQAEVGKRLPVNRGILVVSVEANSAAASAGVQSGDILVELNDRAVTKVEELRPLIRKLGFGGQVILTVYRSGKKLRLRGWKWPSRNAPVRPRRSAPSNVVQLHPPLARRIIAPGELVLGAYPRFPSEVQVRCRPLFLPCLSLRRRSTRSR